MPKFFVSPDKINNNQITIDTEDVGHITRVLRLGVGDRITVCDTAGFDYDAEICDISNAVLCNILSKTKSDTEPNIDVTLYQALPKASKMEYIIQKTTELGIVKIVPCALSRCVVKLDSKDAKKKVERWQKIADSAAKQSGRGIIPKICDVVSLYDAIIQMKQADLAFVPYECEEKRTIKSKIFASKAKTISFLIGPEGGFAPEEIEKLSDAGIEPITLGKRILRTETAGEAVLAMLMYELGDINL